MSKGFILILCSCLFIFPHVFGQLIPRPINGDNANVEVVANAIYTPSDLNFVKQNQITISKQTFSILLQNIISNSEATKKDKNWRLNEVLAYSNKFQSDLFNGVQLNVIDKKNAVNSDSKYLSYIQLILGYN